MFTRASHNSWRSGFIYKINLFRLLEYLISLLGLLLYCSAWTKGNPKTGRDRHHIAEPYRTTKTFLRLSSAKKHFGPKFFLNQIFFWPKNILGPKFCLRLKILFGPNIVFGPKKNFHSTIHLGALSTPRVHNGLNTNYPSPYHTFSLFWYWYQ